MLVFDSGARYSPRFDIGSAVILPYLRARGRRPDRLVISHGDADHIGGAEAVLAAYPDTDLVGQDIDNLAARHKSPCYRHQRWQWDGVNFEFLSPPAGAAPADRRNNRSCVLRVSSPAGSVLLGGDIEKKIERQLVAQLPDKLRADVLLVPHHGSNTSSSTAFIRAVSPRTAVISAGYRNRYRLPSKKVLARYRQQGIDVIQTWQSGALHIVFRQGEAFRLSRYRQLAQKYWHRQP